MKTACKTTIQAIAAAWSLLLLPTMVLADDFLDSDLWYGFQSGSDTRVYVGGLRNGSATHITIPQTVVYEYTDYSDSDEDGHYRVKHRTCRVTSIGDGAFSGCSGLTGVTIPESVTSIGGGAFSGCSGLTGVTIPESVTSIGGGAFSGCNGLTAVTIPDSVTRIGGEAFSDCSGLTSVTILGNILDGWENVNFMGRSFSPFYNCTNLMTVVLGEKVTKIGDHTFSGCSGLTNVKIGDSVTNIGWRAFAGCSGLTSVTIPDSVRNITGYAFEDCSRLRSVTIGGNVTGIGNHAFYGCTNLTSVAIPDSVTSIGDRAFYNCEGLAGAMIGNSVTTIGYEAFCGCIGLASVAIPDSVTSIGERAFYNCNGLANLTIPYSVTNIGSQAFTGCDGLASVTLLCNVTNDWDNWYTYSPFYGCTNITTLVLGEKTEKVGNCMFDGSSSLESITIPDNVTGIGNGAFRNCPNLTSVTIPDSVTSVGQDAFLNCDGLTNVTIGASIGYSAFWDCSNLRSVIIGNNARYIESYAFHNCRSLTSVTIGNSVTNIGDESFSACSSLTNVVIPNSVTSIGDAAFRGCSSLVDVTLGDSIKLISGRAFDYCSSLANVWFKGEVPTVGDYVFSAVGARGHYTSGHREAWKEVIDPVTEMWEGLIFRDPPPPELRVDSADPTTGSLTLAWDDSASTEGVTYSVYRSAGSSYSETNRVADGLTATSWTDTNYWQAEPVLKPLNYWVVADDGGYGERVSNPVETRHRHGVFVGVAEFAPRWGEDWKPLPGTDEQARLFGQLAIENGGFECSNVTVLTNSQATVEAFQRALKDISEKAETGDYVVVFCNSHGKSDFWSLAGTHFNAIALYDKEYEKKDLASDLQELVRGKNGLNVVFFLNACHSGGAVSALPEGENIAWIVGCKEPEEASSIDGMGAVLPFLFLDYGWMQGGAGIPGKMATFADLWRYANPQFKKLKQLKVNPIDETPAAGPQAVLEHFIAGRLGEHKHTGLPGIPGGLTAWRENGAIKLQWNQEPKADFYILNVADEQDVSQRVYCGPSPGGNYSNSTGAERVFFTDTNASGWGKIYHYSVAAMNEHGIMGFSEPPATGVTQSFEQWCLQWALEWAAGVGGFVESALPDVQTGAANFLVPVGEILIPSVLGGYPMTHLQDGAFENCDGLTSVTIPSSVMSVGANAFAGCSALATLYVPAEWEGTDMLAAAGVPEGCEVVYGGVVRQTVHFDANGGTSKKASVTCPVGGTYSGFPTATWENHVFQGWYDDPAGGTRVRIGMEVTAEAERTLYAHWKRQTVHFDATGGKSKKESVTCYVGGTYSGFPACTWENHVFQGWYDDPEGGTRVKNGMPVTAETERTLYAHWKRQTVRFDANGGTCKKKSVACYVGGTYTTLASASWDGRKFLGWYDAPTGGNRVKLGMEVTADAERTLYAHWEQTIRFDGNGGTIKKASVTCVIGETYTTLASAKWDGRKFLGWYDAPTGGNRVKLGMEVTADAERTLYAHWEQTVRFDGNGGTCSKTTATYIIGETYSGFKTATRNGFTFKGWYTAKEGGARVKNGMTVTADAERTLYAHWQTTAAALSITGFSRSSRPVSAVRDARAPATECTLRVETIADAVYEIQWTPALGGAWTVLKRWTADADGETAVSVSVPAGEATGFFRVREVAD